MNSVAAVSVRGGVSVMDWIRAKVRRIAAVRPLRLCRWCGDQPRRRGRAFCSHECHTAWRADDAVRRGYCGD